MITALLTDFGVDKARPVIGPAPTAAERHLLAVSDSLLDASAATHYRSGVGRLLWVAPVRPDLLYATKELCRAMAAPTRGHFAALKRALRYHLGTRDMILQLCAATDQPKAELCVATDASWASSADGRSTTGG